MEIGVIGAGAMGNGIAQIAAQSGHVVYVYDTKTNALERAASKLKAVLDRLVEKEKISNEEATATYNRVRYVDSLSPLKNVGLVIEAIIENLSAKQSVFKLLDDLVAPTTVLASNTSSLSIASIGAGIENPERVMGIHFFNPAPLMPLVEIVPSMSTDMKLVEEIRALINSWKKVTVLAKDTPGFIVNRVARPFYSEAIKMMEEGVADMATIDWAMREIGGFRMGPFELTDLIGHDVNYVVTETVWEQFYYDPRFRPSISQKRLVEGQLFGRKSGRGWFDYTEGAAKPTPVEDTELGQMIVDRIVAMLVNEAADALLLGIGTAEEIDLAMTKGVNYPKGPLTWANEIGLDVVLGRLNTLFEEYGDDRYRPCVLLKRTVAAGENF
ncbi:3-hydroxybutyryl-CoA dehydrogenase [Phaeocystidibacter marisrubri]|uniref:3-hydroxybutyryl-CoA dehydrogenase n=2 Tax=Phaeocystidibacter marisrubri TaxID=1577780 RepID=A0A6L3ZGR9_9FLAO|nr:3-hydroxybutyryl-CoA dehydrogenase [Phaeocystidibacter marisrubri]